MLVSAELDRDIHLCPRSLCVCVCVHVHYMTVCACSFSFVCMNIIAFYPQYSCPASSGPKACWLQQHFNILQLGLSSQFSPLIYCYSQQLSQPICGDKISETQRMRKDFIWCQERHHRAQNTVWVSLSFPVTEAVRCLVVNVICLISHVPYPSSVFRSQSCSPWSRGRALVLEELECPSWGNTWTLALRSESWSTTRWSVPS